MESQRKAHVAVSRNTLAAPAAVSASNHAVVMQRNSAAEKPLNFSPLVGLLIQRARFKFLICPCPARHLSANGKWIALVALLKLAADISCCEWLAELGVLRWARENGPGAFTARFGVGDRFAACDSAKCAGLPLRHAPKNPAGPRSVRPLYRCKLGLTPAVVSPGRNPSRRPVYGRGSTIRPADPAGRRDHDGALRPGARRRHSCGSHRSAPDSTCTIGLLQSAERFADDERHEPRHGQ